MHLLGYIVAFVLGIVVAMIGITIAVMKRMERG